MADKKTVRVIIFSFLIRTCLTRADVHDVVERVSALHDIHHQLRETQVVLGEQGVDGYWLDHVVHEEEPLGVLEAALCQVSPIGALL